MTTACLSKRGFDCDVVVAGGGPAGSTAATLLAQYGHRVLLLERGRHPRFHIGESMMPSTAPIMQRIGVDWSEHNLRKEGADFIDEASGRSIHFTLAAQHPTYQIERATFDARLFDNAARKGADTRQNEAVTSIEQSADSVTVTTSRTRYRCRYFIDATGRGILMGRARNSIRRLNHLGRFALYSGYDNARSPAARALAATGTIQVLLVEGGWVWIIPLRGDRLSIGLVLQSGANDGRSNRERFRGTIAASPILTRLLEGTRTRFEHRSEANFSYVNEQRHGSRFACCGDAAGFLDPVFSSGVFFAVHSAERIADRLHPALSEGREDDPALQAEPDFEYDHGFRTMQRMIERFYHSGLVHNLFFEADREPRIKHEITQLLAGDLWSDGNHFQQGLLRGRSSRRDMAG